MHPDLHHPVAEHRFRAAVSFNGQAVDARWPRACWGSANGWLMLVGPSPGRKDPEEPFAPGGPNRPFDSVSEHWARCRGYRVPLEQGAKQTLGYAVGSGVRPVFPCGCPYHRGQFGLGPQSRSQEHSGSVPSGRLSLRIRRNEGNEAAGRCDARGSYVGSPDAVPRDVRRGHGGLQGVGCELDRCLAGFLDRYMA